MRSSVANGKDRLVAAGVQQRSGTVKNALHTQPVSTAPRNDTRRLHIRSASCNRASTWLPGEAASPKGEANASCVSTMSTLDKTCTALGRTLRGTDWPLRTAHCCIQKRSAGSTAFASYCFFGLRPTLKHGFGQRHALCCKELAEGATIFPRAIPQCGQKTGLGQHVSAQRHPPAELTRHQMAELAREQPCCVYPCSCNGVITLGWGVRSARAFVNAAARCSRAACCCLVRLRAARGKGTRGFAMRAVGCGCSFRADATGEIRFA